MFHYVYRITNKKTKFYYVGSRSSKISPLGDIGTNYFSSSSNKLFIQDQKNNPKDYNYKIIYQNLNDRQYANIFEAKYHNRLNVRNNPVFLNKSNQTSKGFYYSNKGLNLSEKHKNNISLALTGKKHSEERIQKNKDTAPDVSGNKNPRALKIFIYDNNGELKYKSHGNLILICKENSLPYHRIIKSYKHSIKIYDVPKLKCNKIQLENNGNIKFVNWYARIINE